MESKKRPISCKDEHDPIEITLDDDYYCDICGDKFSKGQNFFACKNCCCFNCCPECYGSKFQEKTKIQEKTVIPYSFLDKETKIYSMTFNPEKMDRFLLLGADN